MAPDKPNAELNIKPTEGKEKYAIRQLREIRTRRLTLADAVTNNEPNKTESFDEYFGNIYGDISIDERRAKHKKTIDSKHVAKMISAQMEVKYGDQFTSEILLQDPVFAQSLQDYIELTGKSKDEEIHQRLTDSTNYLRGSINKVSSDTEYNELLLEALRSTSDEWKYNGFMLEDKEYGTIALLRKDEASRLRAQGLINDAEYEQIIETINEEYVKKSDNEELKAIWEYSHNETQGTEKGPNNETPVRDGESLKSAVKQIKESFIENSGWDIKLNSDSGTAKIYTGESMLLEANIYTEPNTKEFIFYLTDDFGHGEKKGPFKASEIADEIDARQIDGYITTKISKLTTDTKYTEGIKEIPDDMITNLSLKLLKKGADRQYSIKDNDRIILDNLSACLIATDQEGDKKYPTMYDKVKALNTYLMQESNIKPLVEKLLATKNQFTVAEAPKISDLLQG